MAGLEPTLRLHPAETGYVSPVIGGLPGAVRLGLPITSSGDVLNDEAWSVIPAGNVAVLPGAAADRPLYFGSAVWRRLAAARTRRVLGREIVLTPAEQADRLIVLGSARDRGDGARAIGRPILERDGVTLVSWLPHPDRLPLGGIDGRDLPERLQSLRELVSGSTPQGAGDTSTLGFSSPSDTAMR